ncbi:MAG TPA: hypothetical protein VLG44_03605 [Chlamydiales bacterium]|nr:hypothetical protein [Chlamydiales bacterium]
MSVAKLTLSLRESGELNGTKTHSSSSGNVQANGMDLFLDQHDALFDCVEIIFGTERFRIHHTNSSGKTCRRTRAEWLQILPQHQDFLQNLVKDKVVNSGTLYSLTADLPSAKITQQNFSALPSSLPPFSPNPLKSSDGTVPKTAQQSFTSLKEGIERSPAVASSHSQPRAYMPYSGSGVPLPPPTRTPAPSRSKSGDPTRLVQASHNQDANYGDGYGSNACSAIVTEALPEMISGRLRTKDQMDGVMRRGIRNYHHIFKRDYYLNDIQGQEKFKRLAKGRSYDVAKDDLPPPLLPPEETAKLHQTFS